MSKWYWNDSMSEDELRAIEAEMRAELDRLDYDSDEHTRLHSEHSDIVEVISSKRTWSLPRREHGWYLPNDDKE